MKKNIGNVLALYPTPAVVVGTEVNGKVNWLLAQKPWIVPIPGTKRNSEAGNRARQCGQVTEADKHSRKDVSGMLFLFMACPAPRFSLSSSSKRIIRYENSYNHSAGIATRPYCRL